LLILDVAFFLTMVVFAILAPCGEWENEVFGLAIRHSADPGGPYVVSAVHFFDQRYPPFVGGAHPGTTLQLVVYVAARALYEAAVLFRVAKTPMIDFWAHHLTWLFGWSSLVVASLHLVSFHALHAYARRLGLCPRAAFVAVLAYATSFPLLYYGTRVSPEPLLVALTLAALLQADSCATALQSGRRLRAWLFAGGAGAAAMLAIFTKLHLAYPLPLLIVVQVLVQRRRDGQTLIGRLRDGLPPAGCALAGSVAVFVVCSLKVNWHAFFDFWFRYTAGRPVGDPHLPLTQRYAATLWLMALGEASGVVRNLADHFRPTVKGLFTLTDGVFVVIAGFGLFLLWRRVPEARPKLVWPVALCVGLLPVVAFRGVWHYYLLHLTFAAIGFAFAVEVWLTHQPLGRTPAGRRLTGAVMTTLLVHSVSLVSFGATKAHDVVAFRSKVAPYLSALGRVPPGTRAAILSRRFEFCQLDGGYPTYIQRDRVGITQAVESTAYVVKRPFWITPELVSRLRISSVIDDSSGTVRQIPIGQWRYVPAPPRP
jgi:hypothetical protein